MLLVCCIGFIRVLRHGIGGVNMAVNIGCVVM